MSWLLWPWRTGPATGSELTDSTEPTGAVWCCLATVADGCPSPLLIDDRCVPRRETSILDVSLLLATPYSTYPRVQLGLPRPIHPSALFPVLTPYTSWPVATKKECPASESGYLTVLHRPRAHLLQAEPRKLLTRSDSFRAVPHWRCPRLCSCVCWRRYRSSACYTGYRLQHQSFLARIASVTDSQHSQRGPPRLAGSRSDVCQQPH